MYPLLALHLRSYGVLLTAGILVAAALTLARARAGGLAMAPVLTTGAAAVALGLVGARALWVVTNLRWLDGWQDALRLDRGGLAAWGGFVGGAVAVWLRRRRVGIGEFVDAAAPGLGAALALARVGCLLEGCDFGVPTALPWALRFPAGAPAFTAQRIGGLLGPESTASLPVHPTQVYEALFGVVACGVLLALGRPRWLRPGGLGVLFFVAYAVARFAVELVRGDADRGQWLGLSTSQWLGLLVVGAALAWRRRWLGGRA